MFCHLNRTRDPLTTAPSRHPGLPIHGTRDRRSTPLYAWPWGGTLGSFTGSMMPSFCCSSSPSTASGRLGELSGVGHTFRSLRLLMSLPTQGARRAPARAPPSHTHSHSHTVTHGHTHTQISLHRQSPGTPSRCKTSRRGFANQALSLSKWSRFVKVTLHNYNYTYQYQCTSTGNSTVPVPVPVPLPRPSATTTLIDIKLLLSIVIVSSRRAR